MTEALEVDGAEPLSGTMVRSSRNILKICIGILFSLLAVPLLWWLGLGAGGRTVDAELRGAGPVQELGLVVMQFNMRVDTIMDAAGCTSAWKNHFFCNSADRLDSFAASVAAHHPTILATQEGLYPQITGLADALRAGYGLDYAFVGIGRYGTGTTELASSETSAIFYLRSEWVVEATGNFMMSETPTVLGSSYAGASYPMITTWAVLSGRSSVSVAGPRLLVLNTHLDPYNPSVRFRSSQQLRESALHLEVQYHCSAVLLMGDFNSAYGDIPYQALVPSVFADVCDRGSDVCNGFTYHSFKGSSYKPLGADQSDPDAAVDFILFRNGSNLRVVDPPLVDRQKYLGIWPSDHYSLVAKLLAQSQNQSYWWAPEFESSLVPRSVYVGSGLVGRCSGPGSLGQLAGFVGPHEGVVCPGSRFELLLVGSGRTAKWVRAEREQEVPLGAVFSGFNTKDWNIYVARTRNAGVHYACDFLSSKRRLGALGAVRCPLGPVRPGVVEILTVDMIN